MDTPRVSVVTPSYQQAEFIRDNLLSVRRQGYPDVEHVVVDGGSTDETVEILESFERRTAGKEGYSLRWVSEPDEGQSHAVNKGIRMATGDWIGWQNSDDFYLPGAFEALAEALERDPESDIIYGDLRIFEDGTEVNRRYFTRPSAFVHRHYMLWTSNQCTFVRADLLDRVGGLDESLGYLMDVDLFSRLLEAGARTRHVPRFVGAFRIQEGAKTAAPSPEMEAERTSVYGESVLTRSLPSPLPYYAGLAVKGAYLLSEGRVEPFVWKARKLFRKGCGKHPVPNPTTRDDLEPFFRRDLS